MVLEGRFLLTNSSVSTKRNSSLSFRQLIIIGLLAAGSVVLLLLPGVPLGVPGEWVWNRHPLPATAADAILQLLWPTVAAIGLGVVSHWAPPAGRPEPIVTRFGRYSLLLAAAAFFCCAVQQAAPSPHRELKPLWVLYSPSASGYFLEAAIAMPSAEEFLSTYEQRMQEGDVLHIGTHPPGLFLLSRYCIDACRASPTLCAVVGNVSSEPSLRAFQELAELARLSRSLTAEETAGLQLLSLISRLAVPLALLPLALLVSQLSGPIAAWRAGCLWATLPCLAVFFPKSDVLFPLTSITVLSLAWISLNRSGPGRLFAVAAGVVLWLGLMLSLAHLPVIAVLVLLTLVRWLPAGNKELIRGDLVTGGIMLTTVIACSVAWSASTGCNLATVWQWNLTNHAGFYEQYPRTYVKWLLVNPLELCLAVGLPVAGSALIGLWRTLSTAFSPGAGSSDGPAVESQTADRLPDPATRPFGEGQLVMVAGMGGVILMLWLSGKNQGEAARLWCFLTPWILVMAAGCLHTLCDRSWKTLLALQLLVSTVTVLRVNGFSF